MNTADLPIGDVERLRIVNDIIMSYATGQPLARDMFIIFPDNLDALLSPLVESGNPSGFSQTLFLRLNIANMGTVHIPGDSRGSSTMSDDSKSLCRLSSLFEYFISVISDAPLLEKRGYTSLLAMFLSRVVVGPGQRIGSPAFARIYETLSHLPELGFIHLYNTMPTVPDSLDVAMVLLRSLSKGYVLPNLDLAIALDGGGGRLLDGVNAFYYLLEPDNEDLTVAQVKTVVVSHPVLDEEKDVLIDEFASQGELLFSDMVSEIVGGSYESDRVAKFVLRRLADIIADIMNRDWCFARCDGYHDIYPWLIQCRDRVNMLASK